ncbi:MAG: hypothetical protein AAFW68_03065 [Pseudomonadota bacterium]
MQHISKQHRKSAYRSTQQMMRLLQIIRANLVPLTYAHLSVVASDATPLTDQTDGTQQCRMAYAAAHRRGELHSTRILALQQVTALAKAVDAPY